MSGDLSASLYFHIPFCTKKCSYCHFYVIPDREADQQLLICSLEKEWHHAKELLKGCKIESIYFGGGTPALLKPQSIEKILSWINPCSNIEISLEANPENVSPDLLRAFKDSGINRLSIGAQTFDDQLLSSLGRTHNAQRTKEAVLEAFQAGILNLSIDLMYDIPGQTVAQWEKTIKQALELPLSHISLYNLTIEPNTLFFKQRQTLKKITPAPEESLEMYEMAIQHFEEKQFKQYEISAFAKDGLHSRHNLGYWTARPFLGFGPSAYSYWGGRRFRNHPHLGKYSKALMENRSPVDFEEQLEKRSAQRELLAVQLRLKEGVDLESFEEKHGALENELYEAFEKLAKKGWLDLEFPTICLTHQGMLFYDSVAVEII